MVFRKLFQLLPGRGGDGAAIASPSITEKKEEGSLANDGVVNDDDVDDKNTRRFDDKLAGWPELQRNINKDLEQQKAKMDPDRLEMAQHWWRKFGGQHLEPALRSGAVALVDAQWIVNFVYENMILHNKTAVLSRRQELPQEAFLSCDQVIESTSGNDHIQIIFLSYMWLHPLHPDPKGTTLKLVAEWCIEKLQETCQFSDRSFPRFGVFWDYASLFQHPNPSEGLYRESHEDGLFRQGLDSLGTLFSHPRTHCFKVTQFPEGYPNNGYDLPSGANCAGYYQRGWPFVESAWVSLNKSSDLTNDISQEDPTKHIKGRAKTKNRLAPWTPEQLDTRLHDLSFTNAKDDCPLLSRLYRVHFERSLGEMEEMRLVGLGWDDEQIQQLALVIASGYTPKLQIINLQDNNFGSVGCSALADALSLGPNKAPTTPILEMLDLMWSKIGGAGVRALAHVIVCTTEVKLGQINLDAEGCRALADAAAAAAANGGGVRLQKLSLFRNAQIGDQGVKFLATMAVRYLHKIELNGCRVGNDGCKALADAVCALEEEQSGSSSACSSPLTEVNLSGNPDIGDDGYRHLGRFVAKCPRLKNLYPADHRSEAFIRNKALFKDIL